MVRAMLRAEIILRRIYCETKWVLENPSLSAMTDYDTNILSRAVRYLKSLLDEIELRRQKSEPLLPSTSVKMR